MTSKYLKYSQAKPLEIDNDLYKYHLKYLIDKGYVEKSDEGYFLSKQGESFCNNITPSGNIQEKFHVCVMLLLFKEENSKKYVLIQKRLKHPFMGEISFITGKIKRNEFIESAAQRKSIEETGINANFEKVGTYREIVISVDNKLLRDQWYLVCVSNKSNGVLLEETVWGQNYWEEINLAKQIPKLSPILELVLSEKNFILEKSYSGGSVSSL